MNDVAVHSAMQVLQQSSVDAESTVAYESAGNLLIIASSQQVEQLLPQLSESLHPASFIHRSMSSETVNLFAES